MALEGTRNDVLNWAACKLGDDVHNRRVAEPDALNALELLAITAERAGLGRGEVDRTIRSGYGAGREGRATLDLIRQAAGSCVLTVHHAGKDKSAGARGSTALKGALATELEVVGSEGRLTLRNPKQKDSSELPPVHLMLQAVPGTDSVVVVEAGGPASGELPSAAFDTLDALRDIDVPGGVSPTTWQKAVDVSERTFYRHRAGLLQHSHIVNVGTEKQPKYRPNEPEEGS